MTADLVTRRDPTPTRKVAAGVFAGAGIGMPIVVVLAWGISFLDVEVPSEVQAAMAALITTGVSALTSWLVRDRRE